MKKLLFSFLFIFTFVSCGGVTPIPDLTSVPDITLSSNLYADNAQVIISNTEKAARETLRGADNSYYQAVEYAARDALTRFPNDPRAESWKWKMAYYAILAGDTQLGNDTYIDLINIALNSGKINIESLPSWFHPGELTKTDGMLPFVLKINKIMTTGDEKKYLINVSSFPGGSCFLVVQSFQEYSTSLIYDGFPEGGFSVFSYDSLGCTLKDLTNDGNDEVVLENYRGGHVGYSSLRVMDISVVPMRLLPFESKDGGTVLVEYENVKDFPISDGKNQMRTVNYAQNCQVSLEKIFEWNGNKFVPLDMEFQADIKTYAPLKECLTWSVSYARWADLANGIKIIDQALEQYQTIAADDLDNEKLDEVRINKALLYLFAGRSDEMRVALQDVVQNSYQKNGIWVEPARQFLGAYKNPSDIYKACSKLVACVSSDTQSCYYQAPCARDALEYLVDNQFKNVSLTDLVKSLQDAGVSIVSSGWLDLDYDGNNELWFVVVPPDKTDNVANELWIASGYPNGISIFSDLPGIQSEIPEFRIVIISTGEKYVKFSQYWAFIWSRDKATNEPIFRSTIYPEPKYYIEDQNRSQLVELHRKLLSGADPYALYVEYMNLKKEYDTNAIFECATCYFDFGLIAEAVGDKKTATEMYSKLINLYPKHPLTILANSKLGK